jgi:excinuclease UvrABC helicase subunit UvrB
VCSLGRDNRPLRFDECGRTRARRSSYVSATPAKWEFAQIKGVVVEPRGEMKQAAADLEFERAAALRDKARELEQCELQMR